MKLAIFGQHDKFDGAIEGLKISPTEIHLPSELPLEEACQKKKLTVKRYGIAWDVLDAPGAEIAVNKFGKEYNKRAPMVRRDLILNNIDAVLLLGDDQNNHYIEKDVNWRIKKGEKIELLKWPCQTKVARPEPSSDLPPDEDIPF